MLDRDMLDLRTLVKMAFDRITRPGRIKKYFLPTNWIVFPYELIVPLDASDIGAVLQKVDREAVAQRVRPDPRGQDPY
ncbi:hypothetical protein BFN67_22645 [Pseudaminobacter manganicus]|uniref:Uncharacterized protein n=1 Tax=Manganibacter manganicus TaxID=1873176 RepID=A0A1V8RLN4_9HYPH|nr:hypothetical protein BFN67_22645 [Pseudaminobacter manganicus]